jgi:hypothetical protein
LTWYLIATTIQSSKTNYQQLTKEIKMKTVNEKLIELLNLALQTNNAAVLRMAGNPVSKINMLETRASIQNAIQLVEACQNEA